MDHLEWTQAIQDEENGVGLIDHKLTTVRMYIVPSAGCPPTTTFQNVSALLNATLAGLAYGYNGAYWRPDNGPINVDASTGFSLATRRVEHKTLNFTFSTFTNPPDRRVTVKACLFDNAHQTYVPDPEQCEHWQYSTMLFIPTSFDLDILAIPFYLNDGIWEPTEGKMAEGYADGILNGTLPLPTRSIRYDSDDTRAVSNVNVQMLSGHYINLIRGELSKEVQEYDYVFGWLPFEGPIMDASIPHNPRIYGRSDGNIGVGTAEDDQSRSTIAHEYLHSVGFGDPPDSTPLQQVGWDVRLWIEDRASGRAVRDGTYSLLSPGPISYRDRDFWINRAEYTSQELGNTYGLGGRLIQRYRGIPIDPPPPPPGVPMPWGIEPSFELEGYLRPIEPGVTGSMELRLLDDVGGLHFSTRFDPPVRRCRVEEGELCDDEYGHDEIAVPQDDDYHVIELLHDGVLQDVITRTANAPDVTILSPRPGDTLTDTVTIRWQMPDTDGDPVQAHVLYSADGLVHSSRTVSAWNDTGEAVVDFATMPAGTAGAIFIVAFDGFNTTIESVDNLVVGSNHPPDVYIKSPRDGTTFSYGTNVILDGSAHDLEDGWLADAALVWTSSLDGPLGTGSTLNVGTLSLGPHRITLTATDSGTLQGSTYVDITIQ